MRERFAPCAVKPEGRSRRWRRHARHALSHSLQWRLVILFLVLAIATACTFIYGMQKALGVGWRDAARPLVTDYVDRVVADIGTPPSVERAKALTQRLPLRVRISGPVVNWQSDAGEGAWADRHVDDHDMPLLQRTTSDGHRIQLGISMQAWQNRPRQVGWFTLAGLLVLTALAHAYTRKLLRPLDDIRAGAERFGAGDFANPIPVRRRDELGQLAGDVNAMATSLHQMLEAKRGLLLAISHELRSPLTRARLNTELLPETADVQAQRQALLRDLGEMRDLVTDLLESERLGQGHAALQVEATDLGALAREVVESMALTHEAALDVQVDVPLDAAQGLPALMLDRTRIRLLVRNLLDNALRHSAGAAQPPRVSVVMEGGAVCLCVRDFGPGVDEASLPHLAEPFWRPDAARERTTGGVGLGLHLCRLVALAHGAGFSLANAQPGLESRVAFPLSQT